MSYGVIAQENLKTVEITEQVYALVGPMEQRSEDNLGNNATFGFIITEKGVVLIDSGGTLQGAKQIEAEIAKVTPLPVVLVVNTGGQDHRWFGNQYFKDKGATLLTSRMTRDDQVQRMDSQIERISKYVGAAWKGTSPTPADTVFEGRKRLETEKVIQLVELGPAHTGGETAVWLPEDKIIFSGDVVYLERMLGVGSQSQHKSWIDAFKKISALQPKVVVPGHGHPSPFASAEKDTLSYLTFLRDSIRSFIEEGGEMQDIADIDQKQFSYLIAYKDLHVRNAQRVFEELEWE